MARTSEKYKRIPTAVSLCGTALKHYAAQHLKPSSIYTIYVSPAGMHYYDAKHVAASAMETDNPFAPYLNIQIDPDLERTEWYVTDEHGNAVGSEGC